MNRTEALELLSSKNSDDRLRAARCLARIGQPDDVLNAKIALASETNRWVRSGLRKAIISLSDEPATQLEIGAEGEDERVIEQIHADAVEETTKRLVHELRPIIGRLDVCAAAEVSNYPESKVRAEWLQLQGFLNAIDKLGHAASAPLYLEFDLAAQLDQLVSSEKSEGKTGIEVAGPKPFVILGSSSLIQLLVANALRNAIEASEAISAKEPVVVNWGETDRDYWIAVIDRGSGLPSGMHKVFEIGSTTKKGHLGMGLALARQVALTLNGKCSLTPRDGHGTRFEFRWPHIQK